ncbi:DHA2 family efflux MFS transporter permease subunit [Streptomyces sp. NPDC050619]|uniref:DHA2 family efflux MFS transporter permease subunit n=1 Tax=Streptomyces sp. NPDC050619 TaxID=3157214 RepID=UPI0034288C9D
MQPSTAPPDLSAPDSTRRSAVLAVMCLALAVVVGMLASLLVAVPDMARDLRATESQLQWIMNAYGVTFAGLLLLGGALGDRWGRKGVLLAGLAVFALASGAVLWTNDVHLVIGLRGLAGIGAALVMPMTLSIITTVYPPEERGRAVGIWSGVSFGSALLAVLLAGALLEAYSWRSVFLANAVLGALALVAAAVLAPTSRSAAATPLDAVGALLSVVGVGALVFGIVEGPELGWSDGAVLAGFSAGAVGLIAFVLWELRSAHPLLDVKIFRLRGVAAGSLVITAESLAMLGFFFLGLQYLQQILGYSPLQSGLALVTMAVGAMVFSLVAPGFARRYGMRAVMGLGMLLIAAGLGLLAVTTDGGGLWPFLAGTGVLGAGIAFAATPATEAIVAALPPAEQGVASALNDLTRELGGVLGIALLGSVFNTTYRSSTEDAVGGMPDEAADAARDSLAGALRVASEVGGRPGAHLAEAAREAFNSGMTNALLGGIAVVVLGAVAAVALLPRQARPRSRGSGAKDPQDTSP